MIHIIIDSTTNIREELVGECVVVPLSVRFGTEEFLDGVEITNDQFYNRLIESDVLPKTSQPSPEIFSDVYSKTLREGDTAIVIMLSSRFSGTYQSALIAAEDYDGRVSVIDSGTAAIGAGILVEQALRLRKKGVDVKAIVEELEKVKHGIRIIALVDTLEYLHKGGRLSGAAAMIGGLLSIKPVLSIREGTIQVLGKARGSKQGNNLLAQEIQKSGGADFSMPVLLGYTGLSDHLLRKYRDDCRALWSAETEELPICPIGSVIGTHVGPGAIAVAFYAKGFENA